MSGSARAVLTGLDGCRSRMAVSPSSHCPRVAACRSGSSPVPTARCGSRNTRGTGSDGSRCKARSPSSRCPPPERARTELRLDRMARSGLPKPISARLAASRRTGQSSNSAPGSRLVVSHWLPPPAAASSGSARPPAAPWHALRWTAQSWNFRHPPQTAVRAPSRRGRMGGSGSCRRWPMPSDGSTATGRWSSSLFRGWVRACEGSTGRHPAIS